MAAKQFKKPGDIKVAVVGYGGAFDISKYHMNDMVKAGMTMTAVVDPDKSRLKVAENEWPGIETYTSVTQMLKKSEANLAVIVTPHNLHAKLAIQCLRAGRHVVVEKPLAITTAECDAMIAAAKKNKVVLSTYHNRHWDGSIVRAMKTIRSGAIGEVIRVDAHMGQYAPLPDWWRSSKSISGGYLYDWGVHLLEYSLQIIDSELTEVNGFISRGFWGPKSKWKADAVEDEGFLTARFTNSKLVTLQLSNIDSDPPWSMVDITGTKGTYSWDYDTWQMRRIKNAETIITKGKNPKGQWGKYYRNIADHLTKGTKLVITPEWSRRPIHIIDLAYKSAAAGKAMKPKYK